MTRTARRIRTTVRLTLAIALAAFVWLAVSRIDAGTPDSTPLALAAAALLILVLALAARRGR
jgi:uncharacterized membrane-anchored protein